MSDTTPVLDEAFERMAAASFELPNGFVNHGAMACGALAVLDCTDDIDSWARRFARAGEASVDPVVPAGFESRQALGDYGRLPEWIAYFAQAIGDDGWPAVVATWVPRLMPALGTALFHGAIRTAHAVRAIDAAAREAVGAALGNEQAQPVIRFGTRARRDQDQVSVDAVGDERLLPAQHVMITVGAVGEQVGHHDVGVHREPDPRCTGPAQFLAHYREEAVASCSASMTVRRMCVSRAGPWRSGCPCTGPAARVPCPRRGRSAGCWLRGAGVPCRPRLRR